MHAPRPYCPTVQYWRCACDNSSCCTVLLLRLFHFSPCCTVQAKLSGEHWRTSSVALPRGRCCLPQRRYELFALQQGVGMSQSRCVKLHTLSLLSPWHCTQAVTGCDRLSQAATGWHKLSHLAHFVHSLLPCDSVLSTVLAFLCVGCVSAAAPRSGMACGPCHRGQRTPTLVTPCSSCCPRSSSDEGEGEGHPPDPHPPTLTFLTLTPLTFTSLTLLFPSCTPCSSCCPGSSWTRGKVRVRTHHNPPCGAHAPPRSFLEASQGFPEASRELPAGKLLSPTCSVGWCIAGD